MMTKKPSSMPIIQHALSFGTLRYAFARGPFAVGVGDGALLAAVNFELLKEAGLVLMLGISRQKSPFLLGHFGTLAGGVGQHRADLRLDVRRHGPPLQGGHGGGALETLEVVDAALAPELTHLVVSVQVHGADGLLDDLDLVVEVKARVAFVHNRALRVIGGYPPLLVIRGSHVGRAESVRVDRHADV